MRYHFIPLGLVLLLAACGQDPTGPVTTPQVDAGRNSPGTNPAVDVDLCLKRREWGSSNAKSALAAIPAHPPCPVL
jgi:hypothetical protein